uniref:RING-CH-type domain-containing protein n=1 Tax=Kalanchoe fedtschenkoi TaxID=63787 RepID=A0A7N0TMC3_KALFE
MGDVVLCVESDHPSPCCRICHEEEFESCNSLEAPCACSGTVKFAHRDCVQRWCALKGNTTCELCLQQYEPDYTAPSQYSKSKQQPDSPLTTIRAGLEFPRREEEGESSGSAVTVESGRVVYSSVSEFRTAADKLASGCRSVALIVSSLSTVLLSHLCLFVAETCIYMNLKGPTWK